jgi:hypothetical protein
LIAHDLFGKPLHTFPDHALMAPGPGEADGFRLDSMGITGQPLPGRHGPNSPFMFYVLDPSAGVAAVARLLARSS